MNDDTICPSCGSRNIGYVGRGHQCYDCRYWWTDEGESSSDDFKLCPNCGKWTLSENIDESWTCLDCQYREDKYGQEITTERIVWARIRQMRKENNDFPDPFDDDRSWREKIFGGEDFDPYLDY